jgi:hypothetical protein
LDKQKESLIKKHINEVVLILKLSTLNLFSIYLFRLIDKDGLLFEQIFLSSFVIVVIYSLYNLFKPKPELIKKIYLTFLIACLLQFIFVNIDRSRSFYIIGWVKNHSVYLIDDKIETQGSFIKSSEIQNNVAMTNRLREQLKRKIFKLETDSKVTLTKRGLAYYKVSDFIAKTYRLDGWEENKH